MGTGPPYPYNRNSLTNKTLQYDYAYTFGLSRERWFLCRGIIRCSNKLLGGGGGGGSVQYKDR